MKSKLTSILLTMACAISVAALAQTGSAAAAPASAAAAPAASPAAAPAVSGVGTKVGTISMEQAIFATNEGRRDFEALSKKLEPKQNELKGANDEIESLKKQLNTQGDKLNEDARWSSRLNRSKRRWTGNCRMPGKTRRTSKTKLRSAFYRNWGRCSSSTQRITGSA
jgi:Skp family chaperone for outer membrane proteins